MHAQLERILSGVNLLDSLPAFLGHKIDDSLLARLTDSDLKEIGVETVGDRRRLLVEFARGSSAGFSSKSRIPAAPSSAAAPGASERIIPAGPQAAGSAAAGEPESGFTSNPLLATQAKPFVNSLGMPFVPLPRCKTLFCIWELRIRDYEVYCAETGASVPAADFPQDPDHPVVNVRWSDARLFCKWLTKRETAMIPGSMLYRLPLDEEWSAAVGLTYESGFTPRARSGAVEGYLWGEGFPPPANSGNYHPRFGCDPFPETSPVGSFPPNKLGIFDLGGNVWEWCLDKYDKGHDHRVARGASCFNDDPEWLMASARNHFAPDHGQNNLGIRIVLTPSIERDLWEKG